ncbi:hypothetical protein NDU88_005286 [Pleurodeles waltl]|uniref:DDE Tnp4 domain-containing protein n=1 Tax=Pleurodeles waltl TaxID=8319 RepID=A0AAV7L917_PLEWA|nr:hypothetical protein NDU88_005286 [Pleurodeles waltl]
MPGGLEGPEEAPQDLVLLSLYLLLLRRKGRTRAPEEASRRVQEAQRRGLLRQYHALRQKRLLLLLMARRWQSRISSELGTDGHHEWWEQVALKEFGPQDWLENFRLPKSTFLQICNQLRPKLCHRNTSLNPEKKVALALWRLATNIECHLAASLFGVRPLVVLKCVKEVCQAVISLLKPLYLRLPHDHELENMARIFSTWWGFPHCVGAVDTTHIPVVAPTHCDDDYKNGEHWHAMVLQGAVDGLGQFWDICTGFPGGMHNGDILQNSSLWTLSRDGGLLSQPQRLFSGRSFKYVLLGDTSYPLQDWLLKPYLDSERLTSPQLLFNYQLERARSVIKSTFQRLRARWQCLLQPHNPTVVPTMVLACCVLHNVCEMHASPFNSAWLGTVEMSHFHQPTHPSSRALDDCAAEEVRQLFSSYFQNTDTNISRQACNGPECPSN